MWGSGSGRAVSARRRARVAAVRCAWGDECGIDFDLDQRDDHDRRDNHDRRDDGDDDHLDRDDGWRAPRDEPLPTRSSRTTTAPTHPRATTTTTSTPRAPSTPLVPVARPAGASCGEVGAIELLVPGRQARLLVPRGRQQHGARTFPADGSLVTIGSLRLVTSCSPRPRSSVGVEIHALSLFGGAVTASAVSIDVGGATRSRRVAVDGLRVNGRAIATGARAIALGQWALLRVGGSLGERRRGPGAARAALALTSADALAIHPRASRAGLPTGATVLVAFVQSCGAPGASPVQARSKARPCPRGGTRDEARAAGLAC
jgi:hypothetical protein